ncbi:MAG: glycosyltransferase [Paludibacteraceae bacterium]|nr:glycosyltransferase [Paludibacteraceae bacterium]
MITIIDQFTALNPLFHIPLALLALFFFIQLYYYLRYYAAPIRLKKRMRKNLVTYNEEQPPVSVIICAQNESENLKSFLPSILDQDYPKFEVIVVNDGSTDESNMVLEHFSREHNNLKITFLPPKAKYMGRKKMCLSIGIKAAVNNLLLFVDADCQPNSRNWLSKMVRNYTPGTDIVLGYSHYKQSPGQRGHLFSFDNLFSTMQYMGFALCHRPFRGVIRNLSYKKDTYYKARGFSSQLNLETGEDDLFIRDAATNNNTRVEMDQEAGTLTNRELTRKSFRVKKEMQMDNRKFYRSGIRLSIWFDRFSREFFYLSTVAAIIIYACQTQWIGLGIAILLFLIRFTTQAIILHKNAKLFQEEDHTLGLIFYELYLPIYEFHLRTFGRIGRKRWEMWREG